MKHRKHIHIGIAVFAVAALLLFILLVKNNPDYNSGVKNQSAGKPHPGLLKNIALPEGFAIEIFASDLGKGLNLPGPNSGPRFMEFYKDVLFVSIPSEGIVVALPDRNKDGKADGIIKVAENLNRPHGIAFDNDDIYIANEDSVARARMRDDLTADLSTKQTIASLPSGGHWTRTVRINNGSIYISVGSSCNSCIENDIRRASIIKCSNGICSAFARGLRNAVGFTFHPETNEIYATENSRDWLEEDLPPEEINIVKEGKHYGWPFCYGRNVNDPEFRDGRCDNKEPSFIDMQAHSAPLGLAFNSGNNFPEEYKGKLFVAFHGSWNRKVPTGYKIVMIDADTKEVTDFAAGWLTENYKVLGRPVDVIFDKEGMMYVSDDNAGVIYRISYKN